MIFHLLLAVCLAQTRKLTTNQDTEPVQEPHYVNGVLQTVTVRRVKPELAAKFSDKFNCFRDANGMYETWANDVYSGSHGSNTFYCCGYMANGRRQCDLLTNWRQVGDSHFALCEEDYNTAISGPVRRDLCCKNDEFNDCNLCKSFMVWDFTVDGDSHGGDPKLEENLALDAVHGAEVGGVTKKVTMDANWRKQLFDKQPAPQSDGGHGYPPYAYDNNVYPAGFAKGTLREFNDPPVCVYAPNVAGRVIEVRVEPDESGSQVCVDDLHEDSLERNAPGVTQACDDSKLQTCFPDADPCDPTEQSCIQGFAFVISCSESCADGDVDLWFRLRSSINKWTESGDESKGTTQTELATEMWCMWGNQDMRVDGSFVPPANFEAADLDGDFSKWDIFPSDLEPEKDPVVRPVQSGVSIVSLIALFSILALLF